MNHLEGESVTSIAAAWKKMYAITADDDAFGTLLSAGVIVAEDALAATPAASLGEILLKLRVAAELEGADWTDSNARKIFNSALADLEKFQTDERSKPLHFAA